MLSAIQSKAFFKIQKKNIVRLKNWGYRKVPLKRRLICVKNDDKMNLLAISLEKLDFWEICHSEVEGGLILDAEHICLG